MVLQDTTEHPHDITTPFVQVGMSPTSHDFPLWQVTCRVRLFSSLMIRTSRLNASS